MWGRKDILVWHMCLLLVPSQRQCQANGWVRSFNGGSHNSLVKLTGWGYLHVFICSICTGYKSKCTHFCLGQTGSLAVIAQIKDIKHIKKKKNKKPLFLFVVWQQQHSSFDNITAVFKKGLGTNAREQVVLRLELRSAQKNPSGYFSKLCWPGIYHVSDFWPEISSWAMPYIKPTSSCVGTAGSLSGGYGDDLCSLWM